MPVQRAYQTIQVAHACRYPGQNTPIVADRDACPSELIRPFPLCSHGVHKWVDSPAFHPDLEAARPVPCSGRRAARGMPVPTRSGVTFQGRLFTGESAMQEFLAHICMGEWPDLLVAPFAAVMSGIPALLARRISELAVHVLGSTVSPARQRSRSESHHAHEAPDRQDHCGEEEDSLPPRHLDHHDPIWTTHDCPTQQGRMKPGDAPGTGPQQHADPGDADEWPDP